ncbi:MAG: RING domain protein [Gaeavirus sp.]|uniref:RING domain protein n=1 Tax=Gaeavirus sp. TaxID=2487767 RepID=A0A3G5A178_9VIRU|nr:MAG: RING domain protein [Gaeavirus sp.]
MPSRRQRAYQNIYLLGMYRPTSDLERKFIVTDTSGNTYDVNINEIPECSCPVNAYNGYKCKHICFILLRIMKVTGGMKQKYSEDDLISMFLHIPKYINLDIVVRADNETVETVEKVEKIKKIKKMVQRLDDMCPICLDDLGNVKLLDYCKYGCGKSIHKVCLGIYHRSYGKDCVFCRQAWV